ncbi:PREDICTED: adenylylsulfatase HINT3 isoform X2 [Nelumbo nucifera]|uniref:Adenylylsulfatase HINT3 isoform X2 n=1 Tax=Nelumbo nucifera TaxID=4432 RepID=A0A1U7YNI9_NELNU|nr:PREDICTED: adenylylsulfatase HINT3 isoform X2 [Nelumbo nucifera]
MEARRLAVLCSHLRQIDPGPSSLPERPKLNTLSGLSTSNCSTNADDQHRSDSAKKNEEKHCIFCKIIRGESPAFKLYEDDICLCILDLNPLIHGHSLIIPKSHFSSLEETPPPVVAAMCSKVPFISKSIMRATKCDSFNLLVNSGAAAGQVIFHTHIHIVPRNAHDQLWTSKSFRRRRIKLDKEAAQLADHIREQFKVLEKNCEDHSSQQSSAVGKE